MTRRTTLSLLLTLALLPQPAQGDVAAPLLRIANRQSSNGGALKEQISVSVENAAALIQQANAAGTKPLLFLNGQEMTNIFGILNGPLDSSGTGTLLFLLDRDPSNKDAWKSLLSRPSLGPRLVTLSVGLHNQQPIPTAWINFRLTILHDSWLVAWSVAFFALLSLFVWKARTTSLLRDDGADSTYSLARCQMAWWFFLVLAAYLFVYMVTWDFNTISAGTLALIGISSATGLAGTVVDSSKKEEMRAEREQLKTELAALPPPPRAAQILLRIEEISVQIAPSAHRTFISDILTDTNGISLHRLQMFVWTIVLGVVFAISVYTDLTMPDFSATLLGLMGISSGTYIGFKFSEIKN